MFSIRKNYYMHVHQKMGRNYKRKGSNFSYKHDNELESKDGKRH